MSDDRTPVPPSASTGAGEAWDYRYRPLAWREIIQPSDECRRDDGTWVTGICVGQPAPDPAYTSHRVYRRLKTAASPSVEAGRGEVMRAPDWTIERDADGEAMVCTGCGTTRTLDHIRYLSPKALSCCPERKMVPVRAALRQPTDSSGTAGAVGVKPEGYLYKHRDHETDFGKLPLTEADKAAGWYEVPLYRALPVPPTAGEGAVRELDRLPLAALHRLQHDGTPLAKPKLGGSIIQWAADEIAAARAALAQSNGDGDDA